MFEVKWFNINTMALVDDEEKVFVSILKSKYNVIIFKWYLQGKSSIPELTLQSFEQAFEIEYTHNSTAIEGNTLTLMETKLVLEDGISVGGKSLREIYESVNHREAYQYVKECIEKNVALDGKIIKDIHALLMKNILVGGVYHRGI